jgi:hypothetical protein
MHPYEENPKSIGQDNAGGSIIGIRKAMLNTYNMI